jgi:hypothetical protein
MRQEANKSNLNLRLLEDLTVVAALAAYVAMLLCRCCKVERIGWAPDRDKIVECYSGIAAEFFSTNVSALCQMLGLPEPLINIFTQTSDDPWCDPMIRLADYVAGIAAGDPPISDEVPPKIAELVRDVFADNRNLLLFRLAFRDFDGEVRYYVREVRVSKSPPHGRSRERGKMVPLQGLSRTL